MTERFRIRHSETGSYFCFPNQQMESTSDTEKMLDEMNERISALEVNTKRWREDYLRLANACAMMSPDRTNFFVSLMPDGEPEDE